MCLKLFIDDIRLPPDESWHLVRSVSCAIRYLCVEDVSEVSLDHDIAWITDPSLELIERGERVFLENYMGVVWALTLLPMGRRPQKN